MNSLFTIWTSRQYVSVLFPYPLLFLYYSFCINLPSILSICLLLFSSTINIPSLIITVLLIFGVLVGFMTVPNTFLVLFVVVSFSTNSFHPFFFSFSEFLCNLIFYYSLFCSFPLGLFLCFITSINFACYPRFLRS